MATLPEVTLNSRRDSIAHLEDLGPDVDAPNTEPPRRSPRLRLTELLDKFWQRYYRFVAQGAELLEKMYKDGCTTSFKTNIESIEEENSSLTLLYGEIRGLSTSSEPENDLVQAIDRVNSITNQIIVRAERLDKETMSTVSLNSFFSKRLGSTKSNASSLRREAALKKATLEMELVAQNDEDVLVEQMERLQLEEDRRRAEADLALRKKQREIQQRQKLKEIEIEKAKIKILDEEEALEEESPIMHDEGLFRPTNLLASRPTAKGVEVLSAPPSRIDSRPIMMNPENRTPEVGNSTHGLQQGSMLNPFVPEFRPRSDMERLTEALVNSVTISRLPIPEPVVFKGDPLMYPDWLASFNTLIDSRGIPPDERIHYLKK